METRRSSPPRWYQIEELGADWRREIDGTPQGRRGETHDPHGYTPHRAVSYHHIPLLRSLVHTHR